MKKKLRICTVSVLILIVLATMIYLCNRPDSGGSRQKRTVTEVSDLVYVDDKGNRIVYYVCSTTYSDTDTGYTDGVNMDAVAEVIKPNTAENCWSCTVSGLPAIICQKDSRNYLCWTIIPELSCVIEYNPNAVAEEDILRMAESVPANRTYRPDP